MRRTDDKKDKEFPTALSLRCALIDIVRDDWRINETARTGVGLISRHELLCWAAVESSLRKKVLREPAVITHDKAGAITICIARGALKSGEIPVA
jgi:hypothetical protein